MKSSDIEPIKRELSESPFKFLYKIFEGVEKETKNSVGDRYFIWSEHYDNWIDLVQPLLKRPSSGSLLIIRFMEFNRIMLWVQTCVYCGQYYSALRELRFLLEFIMKAYYLDKTHPEDTIEFKIEKDKEKKLYGSQLIKKLDFVPYVKDELLKLYAELCGYTHPSKEELAQLLAGKVDIHTTFAFNESMFNKCAELTNKVYDLVFFIVLNKFPEISQNIKNNSLLIKSFEKLDAKFTLSYITTK